jgi:acetyl esterase/lipase
VARRVSPLSYVREGLPPIFIVRGDQDPVVPYDHSMRLHRELDRAHVPNQLYTIPGGKHGVFVLRPTTKLMPLSSTSSKRTSLRYPSEAEKQQKRNDMGPVGWLRPAF